MKAQIITALAVTASMLVAANDASAQARRGPSGANAGRGDARYTQPPGRSGAIQWNTPNASGNLGGPGTGGGGGNGG